METTTDRVTSWLVCDGALWAKLTEVRREEIKGWLRMHSIQPHSVPVDSEILIEETTDGSWVIRFEEYRRADNGMIMIDPDNPDEAYVQERETPMDIDPPSHWLIPLRPVAA